MQLQAKLPIFPNGITNITTDLAVKQDNGIITYFNYSMPVFTHAVDDLKTFRMITSQFCVNGNTTQAQIVRAFGVTPISVKRSVKLYREQGPRGFYAPRGTRGAAVLTPSVLHEVQQLLDADLSVPEIAQQQGLKANTLHKAIRVGRLHMPSKKKPSAMAVSQ